jgi:tetratricopeptide (TPR) repeat protein
MTSGDLAGGETSSLGVWHGPPPAWRGDRPRLVVVPFAAYDYDGYQAIYARRLAEWLANHLHATGTVEVAFPLLLGARQGEPAMAMLTRMPEPAAVHALCAPVGAHWAVAGRLNVRDQVEWEVYLLNLADGAVALADEASHAPEHALEALSVLLLQILRAVGVPPLDDAARSRVFEDTTRSPEALRAYLLAADLLGQPDRGQRDTSAGLSYAYGALTHDPAFRPPADAIIDEAVRWLDGDVEQAADGLALLRRLAEVAPDYHKVPATIGMVWQRGGDHAEAVRAYREALLLSPDHPYYLYRLGLSLDALDDPEATATLAAAAAADPDNMAALDLLGARLGNAGRLEEAMALWTAQIARVPDHAPALTNLAAAHEVRGEEALAAERYAAALAANQAYAPALDRQAAFWARRGEHQRAVALLERLERARPDEPAVLERLVASLAHLDRPEQELATLNRLARLRPDYWPALYRIAVRLRALGRRDEAIAAYERVLERQPDHLPSLLDLGVMLGAKRRLTEAARLLGQAHARAPEHVDIAYNLAVIQMERGNWGQAEQLLMQVKALAPDDPMPNRVLAEIARRRQRGY